MNKKLYLTSGLISSVLLSTAILAEKQTSTVSDEFIQTQRANLAKNTQDQGFGPQSPRDIDSLSGNNGILFNLRTESVDMNLCNIHFHKNAEHKGGEFNTYAGNGDGKGYNTGYIYSGKLRGSELKPVKSSICPSEHSELFPGDTIEAHYVYSSAKIKPGPTLGACLSEAIKNPLLRVEAQVYVLVNDENAANFGELTKHDYIEGYHQATNIPMDTGVPIEYMGSTTGPSYNEKGSPLQVKWNVRPKVKKVNITSVGEWCKGNVFNEDHAHGVRNLVKNPDLLSEI